MDFETYLLAGYPALWVKTYELDRAEQTLTERVRQIEGTDAKYTTFTWDCHLGMRETGKQVDAAKLNDPLSAIRFTLSNDMKPYSVLFLHNFHKWIASVEVMQTFMNTIGPLKQNAKCVVILSHAGAEAIPPELSKLITVLDFALPSRNELKEKVDAVAKGGDVPVPEGETLDRIIQAATGLTAFEAENALALTLVETNSFDPTVITDQKAQMIRKSAALTYEHFGESFATLGGLQNLKDFTMRTVLDPRAKGSLVLGVAGVGKSHFAKALGKELGRPTLTLDFSKLYDGKVGGTEEKTTQALQIVDAMEPCILFVDEIEKGLSGLENSGRTDGGTSARLFGSFLRWTSDHTSAVYVIGTCNNISKLPPEFKRAERWDALFFCDFPNEDERQAILDIYTAQYKLEPSQPVPDMTDWSGAEIKSLCRIASMMNASLLDAAQYIVPISVSDAESITELRSWASKRCIPASKQNDANHSNEAQLGIRKIRTKEKVA